MLDLGAVSEAEKAWLFERSALVLYPSVIEGFGLVPFEAAAHGSPCMWAPVGSLGELLPKSAPRSSLGTRRRAPNARSG